MTHVTFKGADITQTSVFSDGRLVGHIRCLAYDRGFFYQPKGSRSVSPTFATLGTCKRYVGEDGYGELSDALAAEMAAGWTS